MRAFVSAVVSALAVAACAVGDVPVSGPEPDATEIGSVASPIINGELDTTHQAVVAILSQEAQAGGLCSGTIVKVDATRNVGWVFTAAHCVEAEPVIVLQGDDILAPDAVRYEVLDYAKDERYDGQTGSPYDFAMVRILGVDASTPVIPIATAPDGLVNGTPVVSVGYGRTTLIQSGSTEENTKRRRVSKTLGQVTTTFVAYDMSTRGICQGDSGGPVLATQGGVERVVGIHSFVQGDCDGIGVSGRATAAASFLATELAKGPPPDTCQTCTAVANSGNQECAVLTRTCLADKDCAGFYECFIGCNGTDACKTTCAKRFPKGEGPFTATQSCTCSRACGEKCGATTACRRTPKCGYDLPDGACSTCTEGACCDETFECTADATCFGCLKGADADPACATNAKRKALATCVAKSCKEECAGSGLDTGAELSEEEEAPASEPAPPSTPAKKKDGCAVAAGPVGAEPTAGLGALALGLAAVLRRRAVRRERSERAARA